MNQQVRFCRSFDGTRIAYAALDRGEIADGRRLILETCTEALDAVR